MSENESSSSAPSPGRLDPAPGWERATLEKVLLATLQEQKAARRWRTFVRLAWLALIERCAAGARP